MWVTREERDCIWLDITARDQSFVTSILGHGTGILLKESHVISAETYANLQNTLNQLTDPQRAPKREALHDFGALLFELVLPEQVQAFLLKHAGPVVFSTQELTLPWELLVVNGEFLCLKRPVSRQFSMLQRVKHELFAAEQFSSEGAESRRALIIANCTGDLPAAAREAEEVGALLTGQGLKVDMLVGPERCNYQEILANHIRKRAYDIIHFSGHARFLPQTDTSGIPLPDGGMLMAQDIQRTFKGEPLVFLNACWSARAAAGDAAVHSPYAGTRIVRTLAEAFSLGNRAGQVRAVVGSLWWIADDIAQGMASRFYNGLFAGQTLGQALQNSRAQVAGQPDVDPALWSTYALFGEANLCLARPGKVDTSQPPPSPASKPREPVPVAPADPCAGLPPNDATSQALALGLPWSDDIRIALAGGLAAMSSMHWSIFSTIQLVLGMTYIKDGLLSQALQACGASPSLVRQAIMAIGAASERDDAADFSAISDNLQNILLRASQLAQDGGAAEIGEAHVLSTLLECMEAGGTGLLACLSVDLEALQARVRAVLARPAAAQQHSSILLLPDGNLQRACFDEDALAALEEAVLMAYRSYWQDLRSPHMFLGILNRRRSRLAQHMTDKLHLDAASLATSLLVGLTQRPDAALRPPKLNREFLSENALGMLRAAQQLAQQLAQDARIGERALLEAILRNPANIVTHILQQNSIEPLSLLWNDDDP
jgi:hypothetical protein